MRGHPQRWGAAAQATRGEQPLLCVRCPASTACPRTPLRPHAEPPKPSPGLVPLSGVSGPRAGLTWAPGKGGSAVSADGQNHGPGSGPGKRSVPTCPSSGGKRGKRGLQGDVWGRGHGPEGNSSAHLLICLTMCRGLLLSAANTLHGPEKWEPEPRTWTGGRGRPETQSFLSPQVRGAGAETSRLRLIRAWPLPAPPQALPGCRQLPLPQSTPWLTLDSMRFRE